MYIDLGGMVRIRTCCTYAGCTHVILIRAGGKISKKICAYMNDYLERQE